MENRLVKLDKLKKIAYEFNKNHIVWAVGGSLLLYFKNIVSDFNDIDIMVDEKSIDEVIGIMSKYAVLKEPCSNEGYKTKYFLEYSMDGVDIDIMSGMIIEKNGTDYDCSLKTDQITEYKKLDGLMIPLQSVEYWKYLYNLMGRQNKVDIIDSFKKRGLL